MKPFSWRKLIFIPYLYDDGKSVRENSLSLIGAASSDTVQVSSYRDEAVDGPTKAAIGPDVQPGFAAKAVCEPAWSHPASQLWKRGPTELGYLRPQARSTSRRA